MKRSENVGLVVMGGASFAATFRRRHDLFFLAEAESCGAAASGGADLHAAS
jgi:hypothetical protein